MKINDVNVGFDNGITITFKFPISERETIEPILSAIEEFSPEKDYILSLTKAKKTRSMDANAYMWVLCDQIAKVVSSTKEEIYRRAIREVGVFSDVAVQSGEPCATLVSSWGKRGIGYFTETFNTALKDKDGRRMTRVRLYEGSHEYTQDELSRVIDWIVGEAKTLGIPTISKDKIKEMEASWKN